MIFFPPKASPFIFLARHIPFRSSRPIFLFKSPFPNQSTTNFLITALTNSPITPPPVSTICRLTFQPIPQHQSPPHHWPANLTTNCSPHLYPNANPLPNICLAASRPFTIPTKFYQILCFLSFWAADQKEMMSLGKEEGFPWFDLFFTHYNFCA